MPPGGAGGGESNADDTIYCRECGQQNLRQANFCQRCGEAIREPPGPQQHESAGQQSSSESSRQSTTGEGQTGSDEKIQQEGAQSHPDTTEQQQSESQGRKGGNSRRSFLLRGAVGTIFLGGVGWYLITGGNAGHTLANPDNAWEGIDQQSFSGSYQISGTATLDAGQYTGRFLTPTVTASFRVNVRVQDGPPIDVWTLPQSQFERYQDEAEELALINSLSESSTRRSLLTHQLGEGDYVLIIDNTPVYGASPDGQAVVEVTLSASV